MDLPASQRGALVIDVVDGGPAAEAGLQGSAAQVEIDGQPVRVGGDVITAIDDQPVLSMEEIITYLARATEVGDAVTLTVLRDGQEVEVTVILGERPG